MSNIHKYPTISFRISDRDRREIEARIKVDCREYDDLDELAFDYVAMLNAVIAVLDGAKYLWENTDEKQPHA